MACLSIAMPQHFGCALLVRIVCSGWTACHDQPLDLLLIPRLFLCCRAGDVTIPIDLFEYEDRLCAVMLRAFGGLVIAASDDVAQRLITRHGLPCVTFAGSVSYKGSLQACAKANICVCVMVVVMGFLLSVVMKICPSTPLSLFLYLAVCPSVRPSVRLSAKTQT
jgi:hypothetical protein